MDSSCLPDLTKRLKGNSDRGCKRKPQKFPRALKLEVIGFKGCEIQKLQIEIQVTFQD